MTVQNILPSRIEPGSIADQLLKQGRQEGRQEGHREGRQDGRQEGIIQGEIRLIQTLQKILGTPVSEVSNFNHHSLEQLKALSQELQSQAEQRNQS